MKPIAAIVPAIGLLLWLAIATGVALNRRTHPPASSTPPASHSSLPASVAPPPNQWVELRRREPAHSGDHKLRARSLRTIAESSPDPGQAALPKLPEEFIGLTIDEWIARLPESQQGDLRRYRKQLSRFIPDSRHYICWSPDTRPELVGAYQRVEQEAGLAPGFTQTMATQFFGSGHWSRTASDGFGNFQQGLPVTLTWSIVPDGTPAPGLNGGSTSPSDLRRWLATRYGGSSSGTAKDQPWFSLFEEAMNHHSLQSGLRIVHEPNDDGAAIASPFSRRGVLGKRGDIRISGRMIDGYKMVLAFATAPDQGDIVIDTSDEYFNNTNNDSIRFLNVLTHELGHTVGLGHVCPTDRTKLMEPIITTNFRGTRFDDIQSLQRQYGDTLETHLTHRDNDSAARATQLDPTLGQESSWEWLSIDDNSDQDWFSINAQTGDQLTVRILPASASYQEGPKNETSNCSTSGSLFDASRQQNLSVAILTSDGSTLLATSNTGLVGETEQILQFPLPESGNYTIMVDGDLKDSAQLYRMELLLEAAPPSPHLVLLETHLNAESNAGENGNIDPGETVQITITIANEGTLPASNLSATLSGPSNFTHFFSTSVPQQLGIDSQGEATFTIALDGDCGQSFELDLLLNSDSGPSHLAIPLRLGYPPEDRTGTANCDDFLALVSISSKEGSLSERQPGTPFSLELSTPLPLSRALSIPLLLAGSASINDISSPPVITLPVGQTFVPYDIFPLADQRIEGTESLILRIDPSADDHLPGDSSELTVTIQDSAYGEWAAYEIAPNDPMASPDQDPDHDGWSNLAEYLLDTNPGIPTSQPKLELLTTPTSFELRIGPLPEREDAQLGAEGSSDLIHWSDEGITRTPLGFSLPRNRKNGFLRLRFEMN